jgi:putative oxidoreductase
MFASRALVALLFILAGPAKVLGPKPFLAHMSGHRVPGALLPAVAGFELICGGLILCGWQAGYASFALAGFCLATAFVFHLNHADRVERTLFFKVGDRRGLVALAGWFGLAARPL